jgi:diaminopimelate decarboxylase
MADHFQYRDNQLYCEQAPVARIVEAVGTPAYIYSARTFREHYKKLEQAFAALDPLICYSVKSCGNVHILRLLAGWGSGFDVVSGGELYRVLQAGGDAGKVAYAGVGKTDEEIRQAIEARIGYFNIESEAELANIIAIAEEMDTEVRAALRVNPDVDPKTHRHTTTGKRETTGIHLHIGSPINSAEPYVQALEKTLAFIEELRGKGYEIDTLDLGGGFGADYTSGQAPLASEYAEAIVPLLKGKELRLILEPGRTVSASAGILATKVLYLKQGGDKTFAIIDGAMNDLIRPVLYEAFHFIWPVAVANGYAIQDRQELMALPGTEKYDVVGPICETGDCLAKERFLPPLQRGDTLAVFTAGAYGFVMSSQYNARPRAAEVLVNGDQFEVIRKRETYEDLVTHEKFK